MRNGTTTRSLDKDSIHGLSSTDALRFAEEQRGSYQNDNLQHQQHQSADNRISSHAVPQEVSFFGHDKTKAPLGVISLAVVVFYSVSGGPFGVEASVRAGGNLPTLLGFLLMPFIWSLPEALMTAELASTFPESSGGVAWAEEAFGPCAGWMTGYLAWISGATDNAIYPVLFLDYLLLLFVNDPDEIQPLFRYLLLSSMSISLAYTSWLGLTLVGEISMVICVLAMSPFLVLLVVGVSKVDPSRWFLLPEEAQIVEEAIDDDIGGGILPNATFGNIVWRPFLNNLFWNLNSFDNGGNFADDVDNPGYVYPRSMLLSVVMVALAYLIPLLISLGATTVSQYEWIDGYLTAVMTDIGGPWLGAWTVFASGISNIGMFEAELSSDAYQLMGMADRGHVPKIFSTRSIHGTPTYCIILGTVVILVMGITSLDQLIEMLNFNYALSLLLEYCAFIKLRMDRTDIVRPFRVPLSTTGCMIALIPTYLSIFAVLALANYKTYMFSIGANLIGLLLYFSRRHMHENIRGTDDLPNDRQPLVNNQ